MTIAVAQGTKAAQAYGEGVMRYFQDFNEAFMISVGDFVGVEREKVLEEPPADTVKDYSDLLHMNLGVAEKAVASSIATVAEYHFPKFNEAYDAMLNTLLGKPGKQIDEFFTEQAELLDRVVYDYPQAIKGIRDQYGFHFDNGRYIKAGETDRFVLWQVLPTHKDVTVKKDGKPLITIPPFVLGTNILAFLPGDNKSYVHAFANRGIPTYIRVAKNIWETPAFQVMTGEDDARDTRYFCEIVKKKHGKNVTLNGYCQGGFMALCDILSGELDGLVDALITCVSPMDGTRSPGLAAFLKSLPPRFNQLAYGTKTLPNGNKVADGKLMGWVYKLRAIESEYPLVDFYRDLVMISAGGMVKGPFNKTALAIKYWLAYERTDLPLAVTRLSFDQYNIPISKDGTLPVRLFDRKLNLHRIPEKGIKWLICYGEKDDLVEKETALAPTDFIDVEVAEFPKGHLAIATSWSNPKTEFSLDKRFGKKNQRGPVLFQLEIDQPGKGEGRG
ncbi:MAG TPA: metal transporter [Deltaproteobacteria bacterium]|nr:metal transporter [Deltaproteobacteria bacterium]HOI06450.1 metal transporter [Deltaproteobacteria bacterium]